MERKRQEKKNIYKQWQSTTTMTTIPQSTCRLLVRLSSIAIFSSKFLFMFSLFHLQVSLNLRFVHSLNVCLWLLFSSLGDAMNLLFPYNITMNALRTDRTDINNKNYIEIRKEHGFQYITATKTTQNVFHMCIRKPYKHITSMDKNLLKNKDNISVDGARERENKSNNNKIK